jgi:hypothetical protein
MMEWVLAEEFSLDTRMCRLAYGPERLLGVAQHAR